MTTSILAQKLLSVKLDKAEFEKVKWLRYNIMEKIHDAVSALKQVVDEQIANKMCRLCLKPGGMEIFGNTQDYNLANNIKYILGVEIHESDGKPQHICKSCLTTVKSAAELKQTAEITQWRLEQELDMVTDSPDWEPMPSEKCNGNFVEKGMKIVREWTCSSCKRTFPNQEEFNEHEKLKECKKTKCFVCETCGLELKTVTRLNRHRLTHTGELQFACVHCPYRARTKYALIVHERSHTGDRPVKCPHCTATFPNSSNLASHKRKHFPPAYHCHICQKGFKFKEALQNHMATQHSNAKPFICSLCGKAFSTRKMIRRHELKIHNRPKMRSGVLPSYLKQHEELDT